MWWCALTRPGVTRQPRALSVSAAGGSLPGAPTASTMPSEIATQPPGMSSPAIVTSSSASRISRSASGTGRPVSSPLAAARPRPARRRRSRRWPDLALVLGMEEAELGLGVEQVEAAGPEAERDARLDLGDRVLRAADDERRALGELDPGEPLAAEILDVGDGAADRAEQPVLLVPDDRVLGADADDHLVGQLARDRADARAGSSPWLSTMPAAAPLDGEAAERHPRAADEAADEAVGRPAVDLRRAARAGRAGRRA